MKKQSLSQKKSRIVKRKPELFRKNTIKGYYLMAVPASFKQKLENFSEEQQMEPFKILNQALQKLIQAQEDKSKPSLYELSKHILEKGQFEGHETLASDKKHLKGFGQKRSKGD